MHPLPHRRRVVVTGLGIVACNGNGVDEFWRSCRSGRSGLSRLDVFDAEGLATTVAGQCRGFDVTPYLPAEVAKRVDRFVHFGVACARMATEHSRLDLTREDPSRVGVVLGSGLGGMMYHEEQMIQALADGPGRIHPLGVQKVTPNAVAAHIAIQLGLRGPNFVISTACASSAHAIGEALRKIQYGEMDVCYTGGVECPLTRFNFGAYAAMRVMTKHCADPATASRPFDRTRDGFVMSEGGAVLVLEERERALRRGVPILAEVTGYACNSGAHHMVVPDETGADAAAVMQAAVADAGGPVIDHINAHATATRANDAAETRAIKAAFGEAARRIPVTATKSMIGHALGAAGALEAAVCVLSLVHQFVTPTINLREPDPECDLDCVPLEGRSARLRHVLSNSFGFGSCNVALVFSQSLENT